MAEHRPLDACGVVPPGDQPSWAGPARAEQATALLALWNDVDPALEAEYEAWHAGEHVPQRLTVPGMLWACRYGRQASPRYLTLYGLRDAAVLEGEAYRRLLREPTPMSRRMRPALRNVSRWVCGLVEVSGLELGRGLVVWTADSADAGPSGGAWAGMHAVRGRLVAQRLAEASPLPWLQAGQGDGIEGGWLLALVLDEGGAGDEAVYARLPVGSPGA